VQPTFCWPADHAEGGFKWTRGTWR
jgi:hypothetical protein